MDKVISAVETTTRNARKMKYWTLTFGDATTVQLTRDIQGQLFLGGVLVTDSDTIKDLNEAISIAIKEPQLNQIKRTKGY